METYEASDGKVMQVEWGGIERARFLPKRISRGGNVVDIFIDPDDWPAYHETQAERAAQRGETYTPIREEALPGRITSMLTRGRSSAGRERPCAFASESISALDFQEQASRFSAWIQ